MYLMPDPHFDDVKVSFLSFISVKDMSFEFHLDGRSDTKEFVGLISRMSVDVGQNYIRIPDISRCFHIHMCCI